MYQHVLQCFYLPWFRIILIHPGFEHTIWFAPFWVQPVSQACETAYGYGNNGAGVAPAPTVAIGTM